MDKVMVFIDGNNFSKAVTNLYGGNQRIDLEKLALFLAEKVNGRLQRFYYYLAQGDYERDPEKFQKTQSFIDALNKKTNRCIAKPGYLQYLGKDKDDKDIFIEKGTDVNIAVDILSLAFNNSFDIAIIISADTDYIPVINTVRQLGKIMIVGIVDTQKAGYIKESCDAHIILLKNDLDNLMMK